MKNGTKKPANDNPTASPAASRASGVDLAGEFEHARLGDKRRNKRAARIAEAMVSNPEQSIPRFAGGPSGAEAVYRFVGNDTVSAAEIVECHAQRTAGRCRGRRCIIVIGDTTSFGYGKDTKRTGMGDIGGGGVGFRTHVSLCVDEDTQVPLGVIATSNLVRPMKYEESPGPKRRPRAKKRVRHAEDSEENESARWGEQAAESGKRLKDIDHIHVADREADDYKYLVALKAAGEQLVSRVKKNRKLADNLELFAVMQEMAIRLTREVKLSRRGESPNPRDRSKFPVRAERMATLEVSAGTVEIRRPERSPRALPKTATFNYVLVQEVNVPEGVEPVVWRLVTTLDVTTPEQIARVVDIYRMRWIIEEYFKVLKTGCRFNDHQLESFGALERLLAVSLVAAWKMLEIRTVARVRPDAPALEVLTPEELTCLRALHDAQHPKARLPEEVTVKRAMYAIAALGGHFKSNGDPGWQTLGHGFRRLWQAQRDLAALLGHTTHIRLASG